MDFGTVEIIGLGISFMIGLIMGLIGGGGSLLLPTFVYVLKIDVVLATAYTLLLVGVTAIFGAVPRIKAKKVDFVSVFALGIPIFLGTLIVRFGIHYVPETLLTIGEFNFTRESFVLILFASVLLLSFASMAGLILKNMQPRPNFRKENPKGYYSLILGGGLAIGLISGVVGAGGGVMIVPLLVLVMGLDMRTVIGTSLTIMALKSPLSFFLTDAFTLSGQIEWVFLLAFASCMIAGVLIGTSLARRISADKLKKGFGWFILIMAIFIFVKELAFSNAPAANPEQDLTTALIRE